MSMRGRTTVVEGARPVGPETHQCPSSGTSRAMANQGPGKPEAIGEA